MNCAGCRLAILVIGLVIWAVMPAPVIPDPATSGNCTPSGEKPLELSTEVPIDVTFPGVTTFTFETLQPHFDQLTWDTFVALNRHTRLDGSPDAKKIGEDKDNLAIWELWKEDYEIFLENGAEPTAWGTERRPPSHFSEKCKQLFLEKQKELRDVGRPLMVLEASVEPFDSGPLIDQNGRYARFEILVNQAMFEHIRTKKLYSKAGQANDPENVVFPCGEKKNGKQGSIMIKAAWKVLTEVEKKEG